jgi:multidrug efflux pump subunit AcrA (membrane-fusion protein)
MRAPSKCLKGWAAAAIAACLFVAAWPSNGAERRPPRPPRVPGGVAVTVIKAKKACLDDTVGVTGVLLPRALVLVRPDQEGLQVSQVQVEAGDAVKTGQTLAQLVRPDAPPGAAGATASVLAPVAGVVVRRAAIIGTLASARAEPLFEIAAQGDLELSAEVPAKDLTRLAPGQVARVKIIGIGELPGWVRFASSSVDRGTQQGEVRVFVGSNPALRVGTFARAIVTLGQNCGVTIPLSAVLYGAEGAVVQVVRDQHVETHAVGLGLASQGRIQIAKGLAEGDMVVVRAGAFLRDGDRVRPVLEDEATAGK